MSKYWQEADHIRRAAPRKRNYFSGPAGDPNFFLHISSSWVKIRLHTENQLARLPGSALKVYVGGWGEVGGVRWGGWVGGPTHYFVYPNSS